VFPIKFGEYFHNSFSKTEFAWHLKGKQCVEVITMLKENEND